MISEHVLETREPGCRSSARARAFAAPPGARARWLFALAALSIGAWSCEEGAEPRWLHLAPLFTAPAADGIETHDELGGPRLVHSIPRAAWKKGRARSGEQEWRSERPGALETSFLDRHAEFTLHAGARGFPQLDARRKDDMAVQVEQGLFFLLDKELVLRLPEGEQPPVETELVHSPAGGHFLDGVWRSTAQEIVAEGVTVHPGQRIERELAIPPGSALRLVTVARPVSSDGRARFRVELDGATLLDVEQAVDGRARPVHRLLALPPDGRASARLALEVQGDPCLAVFAHPIIGPAEVGSQGARPWNEERPDVVIVVADTFRADCLAAYGGDPAWTPRLNALAQRSVRFLRARAPSTWTLPSHATLFSGLLPPQHGLVSSSNGLDPGLATLADLFAAQGYRTGAITESVFVSRRYGLDHGFEWFEEHRSSRGKWTLVQTLAAARELVARDDGRPLLLFVHTYRTHQPYRQGPEESSAAFKALVDRIRSQAGDAELDRRGRDAVRSEFAEDYRRLYLDGVRQLDEQLGTLLAELEGGVLRRGLLVFTSDHGESFFEHGRRGHNNDPHEEEIRVPLLLSGGGLAPRDVPFGASLADVAPTLAELCGLARPGAWSGCSLLTLDRERALFSHDLGAFTKVAVVAGTRKIMVSGAPDASLSLSLERAELEAAFDLDRDPGELEDLRAREAWPAELAREVAPLWEVLSRPVATAAEVSIDAEFAETLRELGY